MYNWESWNCLLLKNLDLQLFNSKGFNLKHLIFNSLNFLSFIFKLKNK